MWNVNPHNSMKKILQDEKKYLNEKDEKIKYKLKPGVNSRFHIFFSKFASNLFDVLGSIFPYNIPSEELSLICTKICTSKDFEGFHQMYQEYKNNFSGAPFTLPTTEHRTPLNCTVFILFIFFTCLFLINYFLIFNLVRNYSKGRLNRYSKHVKRC